ncbi:MAG: hypothetical protein KDK25_00565 [Leptospiraceae bacterium]|nr:hypothetical protein [Leptospiraceae bacterium]
MLTTFAAFPDALIAESPAEATPEEAGDGISDFDLSEFDKPYHFGGFFRQGISGLKPYYPYDKGYTDMTSESRLRLRAEYSRGPLEAEISGNADYLFTNHPESPAFLPLYASEVRNRALSMESIQNKKDYLIRADIHRMSVAYKTPSYHITAGRQAISWGEGRLLNPMDLITPVGPLIQDLEDVPGADALNGSYFLNSYDSLQLVLVPYTRSSNRDLGKLRSEDLTAIARFKGTFGNVDIVFLGGQQHRSYVWGTEFNLTIWDAGFRFAYLGRQENEQFHTDYLAQQDTHQFVLGASYAFWGELRSTLEIFFNSRPYGDDPYIPELQQTELKVSSGSEEPEEMDTAFFRTKGRILTRNHYLVQASVGYNITELITADVFAIWDPEGGSLLYGPQFSYNASNEIIIVGGARLYRIGKHPEEAEFAGAPPQAFIYMRWHF